MTTLADLIAEVAAEHVAIEHRSGVYRICAYCKVPWGKQGCKPARLAAAFSVENVATLRQAVAIGYVSWDGDGWHAKDAGYDYDDAEETLSAAAALLSAITVAG